MLKQRILTALVIAPIAIAGVFFLPYTGFAVFVGLVLTVAAWEWGNLAGFSNLQRYAYGGLVAVLLAAALLVPPIWILAAGCAWWLLITACVVRYPAMVELWSHPLVIALFGLPVLVPGFISLLELKRSVDPNYLILLLFFLIWGADIGAYFCGKAFGKVKLLPAVSPGKSWAGFYGGMATALCIALGMSAWLGKPELASIDGGIFLAACLVVAIVSVLGDLTISMFKRQRGVKDSSQLLPGHGGFLDRLDSLLAAGPVFALFIVMYGWQ